MRRFSRKLKGNGKSHGVLDGNMGRILEECLPTILTGGGRNIDQNLRVSRKGNTAIRQNVDRENPSP